MSHANDQQYKDSTDPLFSPHGQDLSSHGRAEAGQRELATRGFHAGQQDNETWAQYQQRITGAY